MVETVPQESVSTVNVMGKKVHEPEPSSPAITHERAASSFPERTVLPEHENEPGKENANRHGQANKTFSIRPFHQIRDRFPEGNGSGYPQHLNRFSVQGRVPPQKGVAVRADPHVISTLVTPSGSSSSDM